MQSRRRAAVWTFSSTTPATGDRKSTRLNSSHTEIYTLSLHDALPISHQLDVTDEAAVYRVTDAIETQSGGVDVLVNNAGYGLVAGVEETSLAETRAQFEVNVFGALAVMQAALPYMRARRAG